MHMRLAAEPFLPSPKADAARITLPCGLVGLGELRQFELTPVAGSWPFLKFRSHGELELEFLVIEGQAVVEGYTIEISDDDAFLLDLHEAEEALVLNIVTVHSLHPQYVTVNLAGPVVVHRQKLRGKQVVLPQEGTISTTYPLIDDRANLWARREIA